MGKFYLQTTGELSFIPSAYGRFFWLKIHLPNLLQWKKKMQISGVKTYKGHCIYQPKQNRKIPHKIYRKLALLHPSQKKNHIRTNCSTPQQSAGCFFFVMWCRSLLIFFTWFYSRVLFLQVAKKMGEPSQVVQFILTVENHNFFGCWNESVWGKKNVDQKVQSAKLFFAFRTLYTNHPTQMKILFCMFTTLNTYIMYVIYKRICLLISRHTLPTKKWANSPSQTLITKTLPKAFVDLLVDLLVPHLLHSPPLHLRPPLKAVPVSQRSPELIAESTAWQFHENDMNVSSCRLEEIEEILLPKSGSL